MASHQVIGIYSSVARARLAQEALIEEGMPEERVAISIDFAEDGLAAEAHGQSYFNQPSDRGSGWFGSRERADTGCRDGRASGYSDAVQSGACVVTADASSAAEAERVRDIMRAMRPLDMMTAAPA
jgi:hypothetical protein